MQSQCRDPPEKIGRHEAMTYIEKFLSSVACSMQSIENVLKTFTAFKSVAIEKCPQIRRNENAVTLQVNKTSAG